MHHGPRSWRARGRYGHASACYQGTDVRQSSPSRQREAVDAVRRARSIIHDVREPAHKTYDGAGSAVPAGSASRSSRPQQPPPVQALQAQARRRPGDAVGHAVLVRRLLCLRDPRCRCDWPIDTRDSRASDRQVVVQAGDRPRGAAERHHNGHHRHQGSARQGQHHGHSALTRLFRLARSRPAVARRRRHRRIARNPERALSAVCGGRCPDAAVRLGERDQSKDQAEAQSRRALLRRHRRPVALGRLPQGVDAAGLGPRQGQGSGMVDAVEARRRAGARPDRRLRRLAGTVVLRGRRP